MSKNIIKGYKGIMDLDLTNVDPLHHKDIIEQHYKDIKQYKIEQAKLPDNLKYDNTIVVVNKKIEFENQKRLERLNRKN